MVGHRYFLDIGANQGQTLEWLRQGRVPGVERIAELDVICYEPSPRHLTTLCSVARRHAGVFRSITVAPYGIWNETCVKTLHEKSQYLADSFDREFRENTNTGYLVQSSLVDIVEEWGRITTHQNRVIVKIDAEGAEYRVIDRMIGQGGASQSCQNGARVEAAFIEWHDAFGMTPRDRDQYAARVSEEFQRAFGVPLVTWPF